MEPLQFSNVEPLQFSNVEPLQFSNVEPLQFSNVEPLQFSNVEPLQFGQYVITFDMKTNFDYIINFTDIKTDQKFSHRIKYFYDEHFPFFEEDINFVINLIKYCISTNNITIKYNNYDALFIDFYFEMFNVKHKITKLFINEKEEFFV